MILLVIAASLAVCGLVIASVYLLIRGLTWANPQARHGFAPMRPLGNIAGIYAGVLLLSAVFLVWRVKDGFYGLAQPGGICVDTGITNPPVRAALWHPQPGTSVGSAGDLQACVAHPTHTQSALYLLTWLPAMLLWGSVLLMIIRLVRGAAQDGPFTRRAAVVMIRLGWLIVGGCVVVGIMTRVGADLLTNAVVAPLPFSAHFIAIDALVLGPLHALLPLPALAGAAVLSFGRMTRAAAAMDEELRATV
jgi:hypothetical protein